LRRAAWGRGYATEGAEALIAKAFTDLGASRVVAETMVVHDASRRVMHKCGMTVTRLFRQDWPFAIPGDEHGDVEYAITRAQWESNRSG
jgi:RimJ/RimL family protein N-acetyltransferase